MSIIKTFPLYQFLAEHYSQWQPGLFCLYNSFQYVGLLSGNSEIHSQHICQIIGLSQTEVIVGDNIVRAISQFSNKTDLFGANYTTFWGNVLHPSSLLPNWWKQVPQEC